ncbi:hypothetical protein IPL68_02840 [Candidatus Saccharibacteria bacterium]|nr:MAG: hypothetical protein IPL68_02840 [Candidatus Saccharibacteria bacterium]
MIGAVGVRILRRATTFVVICAVMGAITTAFPSRVDAKSIISDACATAPDSETCKSDSANATQNPLTGTSGFIYKVSRIVALVAGMAAIIVIIVSGIRYMTSGGDSQKISSAKGTLVGAVIGLVVIVLAQVIITFVIKRL